jgi:hypothetical protein
MSTKCAASTRGIVRMVALPRACVCGTVCVYLSVVPIGNRSRSWPQISKKYMGLFFFVKASQVAQHPFFDGFMLDNVNTLGNLDSERSP